HIASRGVLARVPHPEKRHRDWRVAANPLHFSNNPTPEYAAPSRLGSDNATFLAETRPTSPDLRALRNAFGAFATGVTVLTTRQSDGTPRGFTANSFTSVSLDPPLLLVCLAKSAHSCQTFMEAEHFAVNVLAEDQKAISGLFASREPDKFDQCAWTPGVGDVPLIDGALAQLACARERLVDAGDHIILIGRVLDFATSAASPLGYYKGTYFSIGLESSLVDAVAATGGTMVGAVLTDGGRILLAEAADGGLSVPKAPGTRPNLAGLRAHLQAMDLRPEVEFLYAVYEDRDTGLNGIYYHGQVAGPVPAGMVLLPLDGLPFDRVTNAAERSMLERYAQEFRHGAFGIYQGDETSGKVRRVTGV
ncbi:MAG: flavin reductase family protein, partial [Paracoccaceae bacterium]